MKHFLTVLIFSLLLLVGSAHAADDWAKILNHPSARDNHAMAYLGGDQVVMFGGQDVSGYDGETWLYDHSENTWTQMTISLSPAARCHHAMAWLGGDQALMFGGYAGGGGYEGDTWVFNLSTKAWTQMSPDSSPVARIHHAMAHIGDDRVLLFGGYDPNYNGETWLYDLSENNWTQMSPTTSPSPRQYHAVAYAGDDQVVLFGGDDGALDGETWVYDLSENEWTQITPAASPSPRWDHAMAYLGGDQIVLFGGFDNVGPRSDETWVYDLGDSTWTQMAPATKPLARELHAMAYLGGDEILLFGGDAGGFWDDETWAYDLSGDTWTQMIPPASPSARHSHAMASIGGDRALLFGGYRPVPLGNSDETWVYDLSEQRWTQMSPSISPSARRRHAMASIGGDQVVLFGGYDSARDDETWVYDLSADTWTQMAPATKPSARYCHAMAWLGDDQVLLFGGDDGTYDDETWVYDLGADTWTQRFPTTHPSARHSHAMASIGGDQVLLFGYDNQTWLYDLSENIWVQITPATAPSSRYLHAMVFFRGWQVLMFGGYDYFVNVGDTWVFDISDSAWTQMTPDTNPSPRRLHAMANLESGQVLMFGGYGDDFLDDTWVYGSAADLIPPDAVEDLSITLEDGSKSSTGNLYLLWSEPHDNVGVARYVVYRSADPDLTGDSLASVSDTFYTDLGAAGDTLSHYFYVIRAVDAAGNPSLESNRVGEFDRPLVGESR